MANVRAVAVVAGLGALGAWLWWRARAQPAGAEPERSAWGAELEFIDVTAQRIVETVRSALPRGYRNNNPGNLRYLARNAWNGQLANDGGYGVYESPALGTRALARQLLKYADSGLVTVGAIIGRWAPPVENLTGAYVAAVAGALGVRADERIDVRARLPQLARAIAKHENGYVDSSYNFDEWVRL